MKLSTQPLPQPKTFIPFSLTITFETEEELGAFYALFNHSKITNVIKPALNSHEIAQILFDTNRVHNEDGVNYIRYFDKLCNIIK